MDAVPDCAICQIFLKKEKKRNQPFQLEETPFSSACSISLPHLPPIKAALPELNYNAASYLERIEQSNDDMPHGWPGLPYVRDAYIVAFREKCQAEYGQMPSAMTGRGIVTCVGGAKFFACAWAQIATLRTVGCHLPVEIWYMGRGEMDDAMKSIVMSLGNVTLIDALAVARSLPKYPRKLNGWELKPFSILHSSFQEVLFLDADCIPLSDPTHLFENDRYKQTGAIFWPDIPPSDRKEWLPSVVWENCGMSYSDEVDFESGQMLINKEKCWKPLNVTMWMNEHSDYYYKFVFGDKSTYHLGWRGCGFEYAMPRACDWKHPALLQYSTDGHLLFLHCCRGKEMLYDAKRITTLPEAGRLQDICLRLKRMWNGKIYDYYDGSREEIVLAESLVGRYQYRRLHNNESYRGMQLLDNGYIGAGSGKCEKRWAVRFIDGELNLIFIGEAHKDTEIGMVFFRQDADGVWRGRWEAHERCEAELVPYVPEQLPDYFYAQQGTWDENIYKSVAGNKEYQLPVGFRPDDVIIDLGAHIGAFSYTALTKGAARVVAVEPCRRNFDILTRNLKFFGKRRHLINKAVAGSAGKVRERPWHGPNTGGVTFEWDEAGTIEAVTLDTIIDEAAAETIRLIKIDVEGFEKEAILNCTQLAKVKEIIGQYHVNKSDMASFTQAMQSKFEQEGFTYAQEAAVGGDELCLGYFRAINNRNV